MLSQCPPLNTPWSQLAQWTRIFGGIGHNGKQLATAQGGRSITSSDTNNITSNVHNAKQLTREYGIWQCIVGHLQKQLFDKIVASLYIRCTMKSMGLGVDMVQITYKFYIANQLL